MQSLDQQYLEFEGVTRPVFHRFPQLEPLRQFIFRELLTDSRPFGFLDSAKRWLRPLVKRHHTTGPLQPCDILVLVEGCREVIRDTLLPVLYELRARNERVQLVSLNGPDDLPPPVVTVRFPSELFLPQWARDAWEALCSVDQGLAKAGCARSFFSACADTAGLMKELERILDVTRPKVVVTASTQMSGGAALLVAAQARRIRTVLLQHGVLQPFYLPILADWMCTWGESSNQTLSRLGVNAARLQPLGSPRHDAMRPMLDGRARQKLLESLSLADRPTVTFFSNGNDLSRNGSAPLECARWLEAAAERYRDEVNIIVRLHPNEDGSLYRAPSALVVVKQRPAMGLLLEGSDCVGSLCSTVMLDALLYEKPVWHFHRDGWPELSTNWQEGLAQRVASSADFCAMIERLLEDKALNPCPRNAVSRVFHNHGRAAVAITDFLISQRTHAGSA